MNHYEHIRRLTKGFVMRPVKSTMTLEETALQEEKAKKEQSDAAEKAEKKTMAKATSIADCFFTHYKLPIPTREHKFHKDRKWRIDFAFLSVHLAVEIEGGIFARGRHTRPTGFSKDIEKYNALTECEWVLLRYPPNKVDFEQIYRVYQMLCIKLGWEKF